MSDIRDPLSEGRDPVATAEAVRAANGYENYLMVDREWYNVLLRRAHYPWKRPTGEDLAKGELEIVRSKELILLHQLAVELAHLRLALSAQGITHEMQKAMIEDPVDGDRYLQRAGTDSENATPDSGKSENQVTDRVEERAEATSSGSNVGVATVRRDYVPIPCPSGIMSLGANDMRTVLMTGIPPRASYGEVLGAIKGGALLELRFDAENQEATVSFAAPIAAKNFLEYANKGKVHIHGQELSVEFSEEQYRPDQTLIDDVNAGITRVFTAWPILDNDDILGVAQSVPGLVAAFETMPNSNMVDFHYSSVSKAKQASMRIQEYAGFAGGYVRWKFDQCNAPLM